MNAGEHKSSGQVEVVTTAVTPAKARPRRDTKSVGALTALRFAYECGRRGAIVSEPIGDNSRYDFIVDSGKQLFRVQVKSSTAKPKSPGVFTFNGTRKLQQGSERYKEGELDCVVTCAGDKWFFFNEPHVLTSSVAIYPNHKPRKKPYRWNFGLGKWGVIGLPDNPVY